VNNRPMNIWLYAKCRTYIDPDSPDHKQMAAAEVQVSGKYDGNPQEVKETQHSWGKRCRDAFRYCRSRRPLHESA
jgi:hypothetical protein